MSSIITTWPKKSFLEIPIIKRSLSFWEWGLREYGKFPIYKRSKIDYLTLAWDQSPVIAWGGRGGGGEWGAGGGGGRRILGLNGMLFRGIRSIIQWDNQILRFPTPPPPPPTPHLSPQAINMTGSLTENFNRKLWCVHRPLLYGISETFPYSTIFICLFQCDCASIKWLVLV